MADTVGTLRIVLQADASEFDKAFAEATADVKELAGKLQKELEPNQRRVNAAVRDFLGTSEIRRAHEYAAAIDKIGDVSKLTAADQKKVNAAITEVINHYKVLGLEAPKNLVAIEQATRRQVAELSNVDRVQQHLTTQGRAFIGGIRDIALGYVTGQAALSAFTSAGRHAVEFLKDSIGEALEAEQAQRKLSQALQQQGTNLPEVARLYDALAKKYQETTVHSDDLIREMETLLVSVGGVMPREMDRALEAVTNLSSGLGVDLRTATLMVAKAFEDNFTSLGKAGVQIDTTRAKAEGMTYVLDQINAKFGGQAQADIETYAGQLKQLENNYADLKEEIGKAILSTGVLDHAMMLARLQIALTGAQVEGLMNWLSALSTAVKRGGGVPAFVGAFVTMQSHASDTRASIEDLTKTVEGLGRGLDRFDAPKMSAAQVAYWEGVRKKAQEAADAQRDAMRNLQSGIADLSDQQVTHISILLAAGKAEADIAKAYGYTSQQLKDVAAHDKMLAETRALVVENSMALLAVTTSLGDAIDRQIQKGAFAVAKRLADEWIDGRKRMAKENSAVGKQIADNFIETSKMEREAADITAQITMSSYAFQRQQIQQWARDQKATFQGSLDQRIQYNAAVDKLELARIAALQTTWREAFGVMADGFTQLAQIADGEMSDLARGIGQSIALVGVFDDAFSQIGEGGFKNLVAGIGGVVGGIAQGIQLAVQLGKALHDAFTRSDAEKAASDMRRVFGAIDEDLASVAEDDPLIQKIEALRDRFRTKKGDSPFATADLTRGEARDLILPEVVQRAGGIDAGNFEGFLGATVPLFGLIERGGEIGAMALRSLDDMIGLLGDHVVEQGGLWDSYFIDVLQRAKSEGLELASVMELVKGQLDIAGGGLNQTIGGFTSGLPQTGDATGPEAETKRRAIVQDQQDDFDRLSRIALATFNAYVANGQNAAEAIAAIGPSIDQLKHASTDFGFAGNAAFEQLSRWRDLTTANQPLLDQLAGLNEMMTALANVGSLDAQTFADMQAQGLDAFGQLTAAGFTQQEALAQMAPMLETIRDLHTERGLAIDDETKKLIDQAEQQGILAEQTASETQVQLDLTAALVEAVGGTLPESYKKWRDAATQTTNDIAGQTEGLASTVTDELGDAVAGDDLWRALEIKAKAAFDEAERIAREATSGIEGAFKDLDIEIDVGFNVDSPSQYGIDGDWKDYLPGAADGAHVKRRPGGTPMILGEGRYNEFVIPEPDLRALIDDWNRGIPSFEGQLANQMSGFDEVARGTVSIAGGGTAIINVEGREIARAIVPHVPGEMRRYGLK